ncbi:MAG: glycosyltransferase family 2 protein [Cyclonatronaceae bacterium]
MIIPTYNDWGRLEKCLKKLHPSVQGSVDYEIIVVDNAPNHNPPGWFVDLPHVRLLSEPTPGSYAARNRGASFAAGKFLAFTDADCIPESNWLGNASRFFSEQKCDMIGGEVRIFREEQGSRWAYIYEKHVAFRQADNVSKNESVTANFFIRRDVFEHLNGFDQEIKSGGDFEFSKRAVQNGYRLAYAENVVVLHPARTTLGSLFRKQRRFAAWGYLNVRKAHGHSGFRILMSNLLHGLRSIVRRSSRPEALREKWIVFLVSTSLYVYNVFLQFLIMIHVIDPHSIRE